MIAYLVQVLLHELLALVRHPSVYKPATSAHSPASQLESNSRGEVHVRDPVQRELVVQELVRDLGVDPVHGHLVSGKVLLDGVARGVRDAVQVGSERQLSSYCSRPGLRYDAKGRGRTGGRHASWSGGHGQP